MKGREIMKQEERRDFDKEAAQWDQNPLRVKLARDVTEAIIKAVDLSRDMDVLDFGCGTGLVALGLQPLVKSIIGADSSKGMLDILEGKIKQQGLINVRVQFVDFEKGDEVTGKYDLIVSSMTLHHVSDTSALFRKWLDLLNSGGRVCFADLDKEDGSFHGDNTGVFHLGFDRQALKETLLASGFYDISEMTAATIIRDMEGGGKKEFSVFLMTGKKHRVKQ